MKNFIFFFVFIYCSQLFSQLKGIYRDDVIYCTEQYIFKKNKKFIYSSYNEVDYPCQKQGSYTVSKDTVFLTYRSGIHFEKTELPTEDTAKIVKINFNIISNDTGTIMLHTFLILKKDIKKYIFIAGATTEPQGTCSFSMPKNDSAIYSLSITTLGKNLLIEDIKINKNLIFNIHENNDSIVFCGRHHIMNSEGIERLLMNNRKKHLESIWTSFPFYQNTYKYQKISKFTILKLNINNFCSFNKKMISKYIKIN